MLPLFLKEINRRIDTLSRYISEQSQNISALNPHISHFVNTFNSSSDGNREIKKKFDHFALNIAVDSILS